MEFRLYISGITTTTTTTTPPPPNCFPSTARVSLENGKSVTMSALYVGDKVKTGMKSVTLSKLHL